MPNYKNIKNGISQTIAKDKFDKLPQNIKAKYQEVADNKAKPVNKQADKG